MFNFPFSRFRLHTGIVLSCVYLVVCLLAAFFGLRALGEGKHPAILAVITTTFVLAYLTTLRKAYWFVVFPLSILCLVYSPIAYVYGIPDFQALISLIATNVDETREFLGMVPLIGYVNGVVACLCLWFAYFLVDRVKPKFLEGKTLILLAICAVLVIVVEPTKFFRNLYEAVVSAQNDLTEVKKYVTNSSWINSTKIERSPKDFVLVIGESARRDYFHIYGYPIENTPFLDKVPAAIVNGLYAPDGYTIGSLRAMLTRTTPPLPGQYHYDYNVIDLAKSAGIKTTWLSNQGFLGLWDTPISAIGTRADYSLFLNRGDFEKSNTSDFSLIKLLKLQLEKEKETSQDYLYVLHTVGSHPDVCERLIDMDSNDVYKVDQTKYKQVACYVSSIRKLDIFLEKLYDLMQEHKKKTGREFSILYFSDHGVAHKNRGSRKIHLTNTIVSQYTFDIPLIKIDSDNSDRKVLNSKKSGLLFTAGLAHWLGIKNPELENYDMFDGVSDKDDFGQREKLSTIKTPPDPAIDISDYLTP